jgi:hypothetical protein
MEIGYKFVTGFAAVLNRGGTAGGNQQNQGQKENGETLGKQKNTSVVCQYITAAWIYQ